MKADRIALMISLALGAAPILTGCDKTTEEKSSVTKTPDGGEVKDTKKETVSSDGKTVTRTEEKTTNPPTTPSASENKETKVTVSPDGKTVKTEEKTTAKP